MRKPRFLVYLAIWPGMRKQNTVIGNTPRSPRAHGLTCTENRLTLWHEYGNYHYTGASEVKRVWRLDGKNCSHSNLDEHL